MVPLPSRPAQPDSGIIFPCDRHVGPGVDVYYSRLSLLMSEEISQLRLHCRSAQWHEMLKGKTLSPKKKQMLIDMLQRIPSFDIIFGLSSALYDCTRAIAYADGRWQLYASSVGSMFSVVLRLLCVYMFVYRIY